MISTVELFGFGNGFPFLEIMEITHHYKIFGTTPPFMNWKASMDLYKIYGHFFEKIKSNPKLTFQESHFLESY